MNLPGQDNENLESMLSKDNVGYDTTKEQEIVEYIVKKKFSPVKAQLRPLKQRFVKFNGLYEMHQEKKNYRGMADLFIPETLRSVETLVSIIHFGIFDNPEFIRYLGTEESDKVSAQNLTDLFYHQIQLNNFKLVSSALIRQMLIYGTGIRKILWDFEELEVKKKVRKDGAVVEQEELETIRDCWTFDDVDILGFYIPPETPWYDLQKANWVAEEYMVNGIWLKEKSKKNWIDKAAADELLGEFYTGSMSDDEDLKEQRQRDAGLNKRESKEEYKVLEWYGIVPGKFFKDEDSDLVRAVAIIVNDSKIVKLSKLKDIFWHNSYPYVSSVFVPRDGSFFGIGVPEIGESLQEELNDTRNQTMDNKTAILMNMWLKDRAANISDEDLILRPNGVIKTNDVNGLKPFAPPLFVGVGANIENIIKEDLRQSVSATSGVQGIPQQGIGSATEFQGLQSSALGRSKLIINTFGESVLRPLARMVKFLNDQFFDHKKLVRVIGPNGIKHRFLSPDEIVGDYDIELALATDFDKNPNVMRQQLITLFSQIAGMTPEQISFHWGILNEIAKRVGIKNFDEFYTPPPDASGEILLEPEEEIQIIARGQAVDAKNGDDHMKHIQKHIEDYNNTARAVSPMVEMLQRAHIASHMKFIQKMQMQAQQQIQMMQSQGQVNGQNADMSPATMQAPQSDQEIKKGIENV